MKKINIIGIGYIGMPLAFLLAKSGFEVIGTDINNLLVKKVNERKLNFFENDMNTLYNNPEVQENFRARTSPVKSDIFVIAVPTPIDHLRKISDLTALKSAIDSIVPFLKEGNTIIVESTIPPRTCKDIITPIIEKKTDFKVNRDVYLVHCPERTLPGNIVFELIHNDRIIGCNHPTGRQIAIEMYSTFVKGELKETTELTAEFVKLIENAFRDVNIAFANELSLICEGLGIDSIEAIQLANKHPRVNILRPGIGVGGHCIALDPWFLKEIDNRNSRLIQTARLINDSMPEVIARRIRIALKEIKDPKILLLGRSYKENSEDARESPALMVIKLLEMEGFNCTSKDPLIKGYGYDSLVEIANGYDCIVILVPHDIILKELMEKKAEIIAQMRHQMILRF